MNVGALDLSSSNKNSNDKSNKNSNKVSPSHHSWEGPEFPLEFIAAAERFALLGATLPFVGARRISGRGPPVLQPPNQIKEK